MKSALALCLLMLVMLFSIIGASLWVYKEVDKSHQYYFDHGWDEACAAMEKECYIPPKFCYREWLHHKDLK